MPVQPEAFFLPSQSPAGGQRFCLYYPANTAATGETCRGLVVYIHPFAEEMNKSRRMAALQARALSNAGFAVLQIDLLGCGDSSGDFADATWANWVSDVVLASQWLRSRNDTPGEAPNRAPLWLWGLRAGCLLAVEAANRLTEPCNFLFWQAPASGKPLLQQFMRLKLAGDMLGGQGKAVMDGMRQQLANGTPVEIAGYQLASGLAHGLEQATLAPPAKPGPGLARLEWFELSTRDDASLSPVSIKTIALWEQAGYQVRNQVVAGPAFWQTSEIEEAPELISATVALLTSSRDISSIPA